MIRTRHHDTVDWIDRRALDRRGELIGVVVDVYDDPDSRRPAWLAISSGFFGIRIGVAPLDGVSLRGADVVIAHSLETVTSAPPIDVVVTVDPDQQRRLLDHYSQHPASASDDVQSDDHRSTTTTAPEEHP